MRDGKFLLILYKSFSKSILFVNQFHFGPTGDAGGVSDGDQAARCASGVRDGKFLLILYKSFSKSILFVNQFHFGPNLRLPGKAVRKIVFVD